VTVSPEGVPGKVWTGSTNWTTTGLCTQLNNALLVDDKEVAAAYLKQWHALRDAGSDHPRSLITLNATSVDVGDDDPPRASVHFTRAPQKVDLGALREIVNGASTGLLFLMFIPGATGILADVLSLQIARPQLLVRGVVSELPKGRQDERTGDTMTVKVTIVGSTVEQNRAQTFDVVQPEGKTNPTGWWAAETAHWQFLRGIGHAIIHSKVLVVDPFTDKAVVVTSSHNFSQSASTNNDENIIRRSLRDRLLTSTPKGSTTREALLAIRVAKARPGPPSCGPEELRAHWGRGVLEPFERARCSKRRISLRFVNNPTFCSSMRSL
jgi:hypothetical protein